MLTAFLIGLGAGVAATPHCLGMCGGFAMHLAKGDGAALRQALFVAGKSFTYVFLGTLAAALGIVAFDNTSLAPAAPAFRVIAGMLTVVLGFLMLGLRLPRIKGLHGVAEAGFCRSLFAGLLVSPGPLAAFVLGLGVGFLPCPLPVGMLAVAAGSRSVPQAMALMAGVGLGTAPGLIAVGLFGIGLDRKFARVGMRAAGVVVVAIGLLTVGRASGLIEMPHSISHAIPSCCGGAER